MISFWNGFIIATLLFIGWLIKSFYRQRNLPHGPMPLPIFGNLLILRKRALQTLNNLATVYGSIFTIWLGRKPIVIVNDYNLAQEVLSKNGLKFSSRPDFMSSLLTRNRKRFPFMDYCPSFVNKQAICKDVCNADKLYLNTCLEIEIRQLTDLLMSQTAAKEFDPSEMIEKFAIDLLARVVYGMETDILFSELNLPGHHDFVTLSNTTKMLPWLRLLSMQRYRDYQKFMQNREHRLKSLFQNSRKFGDSDAMIRKISRAFMEEANEQQIEDAEILCSDLFIVGVENLAAALKWILLYFVVWPEIQAKVQNELDDKYGKTRNLTVEEAMSVPYLKAAVFEVLRLSSLNPLSSVHMSNESVTLKGHKLPKGTCVCVNLSAIHTSPKFWDNPFEFRPSRFLKNNEGVVMLRDIGSIKGFLPFGSGFRKCVSDELSVKLMTTIIANLTFNFDFSIPPWNMKPDLVGTTSFILVPRPYNITVSSR